MRNAWLSFVFVAPLVVGCASKSGEENTPDPKPVQEGAPSEETPAPAEPTQSAQPMAPESVTLKAADGVEVFGELYPVKQDKPRPLILLFHQAGSNAGEYADIAPRLQTLGYNALTIDQRSGGDMWERENRTVKAHGKSTSYLEAYPDLQAALAWGKDKGYPRIMAWGSSYSAALVFKLAADHGDELHAILSFAPGEYIKGEKGAVAGWASKVSVPIYVTSATGDEVPAAKAILDASPASTKRQYEPKNGVHGSSTLRTDRNPDGAEENWSAVVGFLSDVAP